MKNFIEFWEFIQPTLGNDFYRYTFVNKDQIESILIRWDNLVNKFIIVIRTKSGCKYKPTGIYVDPEGYMCKELNDQCYWINYDDAEKYIRDLMNG